MKRASSILILSLIGLCITGCSIPRTAVYSHIQSISRTQTKPKGLFAGADIISILDFRSVEKYDEDIEALKGRVESYIAKHQELSESAKASLRELKAVTGASKGEVELLLGRPDKILGASGGGNGDSEVWIYAIRKVDAFAIFIIPVFFSRQSFHLYFSGDTLKNIEKRYLKQLLQSTSPAPESEFGKK